MPRKTLTPAQLEAQIADLHQRLRDAEAVIRTYFLWRAGDRRKADDQVRAYLAKWPALPQTDATDQETR